MGKKEVLGAHKKLNGIIEIIPKIVLKNKIELSKFYTPGVAEVSKLIKSNKDEVYNYTIKKNLIAIITDGSSVLGLGNIGPEAALPVMEGKALLFKQFANINAFPICIKTQNTNEIISIIKNISPVFGGINLEDISAPRCFEIEESLQGIGMPVMHDDQHGTAIVVLAALINSCKVTKKRYEDLKIVVNGAGAAGTAISKLLVCADENKKICNSVADVIVCDSQGIIYNERPNLTERKKELAKITNKNKIKGDLNNAINGADVFIGVSVGNILNKKMIQSMSKNPIIFAMANPIPEIMPNKAKKYGAKIVATGRSDFPNQVNNVLAFPGIFRAAIDLKIPKITHPMMLCASHAIANTLKKPTINDILPSLFDKSLVKNIVKSVKNGI